MTREEAIEVLKKNRPGADPRRCGLELCTAVDVAIAALLEQEERSKGCSACDGGFGDNTMVFYAGGYKHCPMCGRRLEEV